MSKSSIETPLEPLSAAGDHPGQVFLDSLFSYIDCRIDEKLAAIHGDDGDLFVAKANADQSREDLRKALKSLSLQLILG